ncbi:MAG: 6-phosphogluconolactonase [Bacteriovorax sp.]|nr:6-phosphogluconolactonase [Bacteriovorax sp.]
MVLVHYPDEEALALAAAEIFVEQFKLAINRSGRFTVLLSGGGTPKLTYEHLAREPFKNKIDWSMVNIFWGDERCVEKNDPLSNYLMASEAFLSHLPIPVQQIHPIICNKDPHVSAGRYEELLKEYFKPSPPSFDLVFLGLGLDGHVASLFPQTQTLEENKRWVIVVQKEREDFARITLTLPILNLAKVIVFLVSGAEKNEILHKVLSQEEPSAILPARQIKPVAGKLYWLVDVPVITDFSS